MIYTLHFIWPVCAKIPPKGPIKFTQQYFYCMSSNYCLRMIIKFHQLITFYIHRNHIFLCWFLALTLLWYTIPTEKKPLIFKKKKKIWKNSIFFFIHPTPLSIHNKRFMLSDAKFWCIKTLFYDIEKQIYWDLSFYRHPPNKFRFSCR